MNWIGTIAKHVDYLSGRFEAYPVRDEGTRDGVLQVLDEVRRLELNRVHGRGTLESAAFVDADLPDDLYALKDTREDRIVGCIRITRANHLADIAESRAEYHLDRFPPALLARTQVFTRLAILREYRNTAASLVMFKQLCSDGLAAGNVSATLLSCEPGLYAGYLRLGFRPLGGVHPGARGGFRIPMVLIPHDLTHLRSVRSPIASMVASFEGVRVDDGMTWYRALEAEHGPIDPGVAFFADDDGTEVHAQLTHGLSDAGRSEVLRNAMEVQCQPGQAVLKLGDGGRQMGFVLSGALQATIDDRVVSLLGEGEMFGEIAVALDGPRTASLVAADDTTRVLMLSQNCLSRLDDPDRAQAWRNIARVLATRVRRFHA